MLDTASGSVCMCVCSPLKQAIEHIANDGSMLRQLKVTYFKRIGLIYWEMTRFNCWDFPPPFFFFINQPHRPVVPLCW